MCDGECFSVEILLFFAARKFLYKNLLILLVVAQHNLFASGSNPVVVAGLQGCRVAGSQGHRAAGPQGRRVAMLFGSNVSSIFIS